MGLTTEQRDDLGPLVYRAPALVAALLDVIADGEGGCLFVAALEHAGTSVPSREWSEKTIANAIFDLVKFGAVGIRGKGRSWRSKASVADDRTLHLTPLGEAWLELKPMPLTPKLHADGAIRWGDVLFEDDEGDEGD